MADLNPMEPDAQDLASQLGKSVEAITRGLLVLVEDTKKARALAVKDKEAAAESRKSMDEVYGNLDAVRSRLESSVTRMSQELRDVVDHVSGELAELRASNIQTKRELQSALAEVAAIKEEAANQLKDACEVLEQYKADQLRSAPLAGRVGKTVGLTGDAIADNGVASGEMEAPAAVSAEDFALVNMKAENRRIAESIRSLGSPGNIAELNSPPRSSSTPIAQAAPVTKSFELARVSSGQDNAQSPVDEYGRILPAQFQLAVGPIVDFSDVVELDAILASLAPVSAVALEHYSEQQTVFQVEARGPLSASDLVRLLEGAASIQIEIDKVDGGYVSLHLQDELVAQSNGA